MLKLKIATIWCFFFFFDRIVKRNYFLDLCSLIFISILILTVILYVVLKIILYKCYLGHSDVVTINDALRLANQTLYIVTAAGDCTVKLWIKSINESKF